MDKTEETGLGCLGCYTVFTEEPKEDYEDGSGFTRQLTICKKCGCDLFASVSKVNGKWMD